MHRRATSKIVAGLGICALALTSVGTPGIAVAAPDTQPSAAATSTPSDQLTITSSVLEVGLAADFPRVTGYREIATGATLGGQPTVLDQVLVNGTAHKATATATRTADAVDYKLVIADLPGVQVDVQVKVTGRILTWRVTKVVDSETVTVNTLRIPGMDLVSVSSTQPGATSAFTTIDTNSTRNADVITALTAQTALDKQPVGATYGIVNTAQLAATVETNGTVDKPSGALTKDGGRLWHQVQADTDGSRRVGITPGEWVVRGEGAPEQSELPWAKVVVAGDVNYDQIVNWQDGAVAFREIGHVPAGSEKVADRVIQHIPFNFSSLATHPFLRTLDDVKRISKATDGLGQFTLLKGYANEGHDSAHPDYAGNYNERAGGLRDMNILLEQGKKWGSDFGVHVNATEAYPEAKAFDETLVDKSSKGWNWLNQSYYMNQRRDLNSGDLLKRTEQLRKDTKGNLDTLYWDVYYTFGWIPDQMDAKLREQGWSVASEWAYSHERNSLWSHWATDRNYGGATNKGINSQIARFIRNSQKDVWNPHPLLGGSIIVEAEGWTGHHDWNAFMDNVWTNQLATKFLQKQKITRWDDHQIDLTDNVSVSDKVGHRQISVDGRIVLDGDSYLLPWGGASVQDATKAYHYSPKGGTSTWQLTKRFEGVKSFTLYELGSQGRTRVGTVTPLDGKVTLDAKAATAYVLYPDEAPTPVAADYGQGSFLRDPGFNESTLSAWTTTPNVTSYVSPTGQMEAQIGAGKGSLSQHLKGLVPGKRYAASAWVQVEPGKTRTVVLKVTGKQLGQMNLVTATPAQNFVASDELKGTYHQRVKVIFTAPSIGMANVVISAEDGDATVLVDDVRVVATDEVAVTGTTVVKQDFESLDQGWGPFVSGPAQGGGDARTHLANLHAPYTQAGWNGKLVDDVIAGKFSLKAHEEATGLIYRTWQGTAPLKADHKYRVEFKYQNAYAGGYAFVTGVDQPTDKGMAPVELTRTSLGQQRTTAQFSTELVPAGCGVPFIGIRNLAGSRTQNDFIMDDLVITDLGRTTEVGGCATSELGGVTNMLGGEGSIMTNTFTNKGSVPVTDVKAEIVLPEGWSAKVVKGGTFTEVAAGASVRSSWLVTPPIGAPEGTAEVSTRVNYTVEGRTAVATANATVTLLPAGVVPQSRISIAGVSDTERTSGDGSPSAAIDGNAATMWHSSWSSAAGNVPFPHWISLDLGEAYKVDGFDYQTRIGNGQIKDYEIYVSSDNKTWGSPVAKGSFQRIADVQHVSFPAVEGRYVKLVGLSAVNGRAFGGANELNVWGTRVKESAIALPKDGMKVVGFDSQEVEGEDGAAANILDGLASTIWHTEWYNQEAQFPHFVTIDLGESHKLGWMSVQGRPGAPTVNGRIKDYEVYVSADGKDWGSPVAKGSFTDVTTPQKVSFAQPVTGRYVKVVALNSINAAPFAAIAELDFYTA